MQRDENGRIRFNGHESVGAEMTEKIMRRLRFSNEEIEATVAMVQNHMVFKDVQNMRVARLKRFMARPTFDDELELHRVDCLASHGLLDNFEFLKRRRQDFASEPLIPPPLITGHDLIAMGWKPGPKFKSGPRRGAGPPTRRHPADSRGSALVGEKGVRRSARLNLSVRHALRAAAGSRPRANVCSPIEHRVKRFSFGPGLGTKMNSSSIINSIFNRETTVRLSAGLLLCISYSNRVCLRHLLPRPLPRESGPP